MTESFPPTLITVILMRPVREATAPGKLRQPNAIPSAREAPQQRSLQPFIFCSAMVIVSNDMTSDVCRDFRWLRLFQTPSSLPSASSVCRYITITCTFTWHRFIVHAANTLLKCHISVSGLGFIYFIPREFIPVCYAHLQVREFLVLEVVSQRL